MGYRIVRMVGGSWYPVSKKNFSEYSQAVSYSKKLKGNYRIVPSTKVKKTLAQYKKTRAYKD